MTDINSKSQAKRFKHLRVPNVDSVDDCLEQLQLNAEVVREFTGCDPALDVAVLRNIERLARLGAAVEAMPRSALLEHDDEGDWWFIRHTGKGACTRLESPHGLIEELTK